ncbi:MAG TPA: ABC transporter permease, partial [Candidatus Eisenbacteria bacterium]|nr:ABC transporter permease [Candidatus Eisenbacteria bacterium]
MARYILGRLLGLLFVLFAVSLITFLLTRAVPGDPFASGERELPEATRIARAAKYGFDQPILVQYARYVWNVLHGDFGVPFQSPTQTVVELIKETWLVTIRIGFLTILISYPLGIMLGTIAALHRNSAVDYAITFGSTLGMVVPNFVVAIWLILLFGVGLRWLPTGGWGSPAHLILPVIAYSLLPTALVARYTRVSLLETMGADHVRTARAKGLAEQRVLVWHVARNALIPFVTIMIPEIPNILTGSIFIEQIFRIPGLGRFFVTSTLTRDYPMILALVLLVAVVWG